MSERIGKWLGIGKPTKKEKEKNPCRWRQRRRTLVWGLTG